MPYFYLSISLLQPVTLWFNPQSGYHSCWHTLKFSGHYLASYQGHNEWPWYEATYYTMATYYQEFYHYR